MTLLLAILLAAPAAAASPAPATTAAIAANANVKIWLDRAQQDVRALIARPTNDAVAQVQSKLDLALVLVQTNPTEANKALLREALAQPMPPPKPPETPEIRQLSWHFMRSMAHAAMGETDAARAEANALDAALAKPVDGLPPFLTGFQLTLAFARIGDVDRATAAALKHAFVGDPFFARMSVAGELRTPGMVAARQKVIGDAVAEAKKLADPEKQADALRTIVREVASGGDLEAAVALAKQMPAKDPRVDIYRNLAECFSARGRAGDGDRAAACITAALDTLDADAQHYPDSIPRVGEVAAELGQAAAAKRAVAMIEQAHQRIATVSTDAWNPARGARIAAAVGDKAAYDRLVAATQQVIARLPADDPASKSRAIMLLAAAFARGGDKQRAAEAIAQARQLHEEKDWTNSNELFDVLHAFADAGDPAYAEDLATRQFALKPKDLDGLHWDSLVRHLRASEFDAARAEALRITRKQQRLEALLRVALRQAREGQAGAEAVTTWVAALPDADDRVALHLALVHQSMGIDPHYWLRVEFK